MPVVSVRIPQIGEGLQEARLVAVLKKPGEAIRRDEPIYQMETDKAVMDVESPYEGTLVEWLAEPDAILPIGGEVARMEVAGEVSEAPIHGAPTGAEAITDRGVATQASGAPRLQNVPPRSRAYAKEKGLDDEILATIVPAGSKLMPSDIDEYLAAGGKPEVGGSDAYTEEAVPGKQRVLNSRMVRGNALVVPGTITVAANWEPIENLRARVKASGSDFQPSAFTMFAFAVASALRDFPALRTTLIGDETFRTYRHAALGIAVGLPGDELVLAVIEDADTLDWRSFADRSRERIDLARTGKDQASEAVTLSLTNMQSFGLRDAVPVVVPPSCATLFLGEVYNGLDQSVGELAVRRYANLALTFDHRILNGVGAANFLNAVKTKIETISQLISL